MDTITLRQARRFLLLKNGLLGQYRFSGKQGALHYVRQAGCIQFDPVDVCGKNAELVLASRVRGFTRAMLYDLLYRDYLLLDYPDKNQSILPVEAWPYFARERALSEENGRAFAGLAEAEDAARRYIAEHGPVNSDQLPVTGRLHWHSSIHWSGAWHGETDAARAALEQLYTTGELIVHHKQGTRKFYDLASRHIPEAILTAPDPLPDDASHLAWRVQKRIGAVGLLWNRPSDAFLGLRDFGKQQRDAAFSRLLAEGTLREIGVEGIALPLCLLAEDLPLLEQAGSDASLLPRCELLAPLDCMLWDRKLIRALFSFDYTWEIYTVPAKRRYGSYVLPLLYGEAFAGRVEAVADAASSTLTVKNIWLEDGAPRTKRFSAALTCALWRLARLNGCQTLILLTEAV